MFLRSSSAHCSSSSPCSIPITGMLSHRAAVLHRGQSLPLEHHDDVDQRPASYITVHWQVRLLIEAEWRIYVSVGINFDALAVGKWYWSERRPECRIRTQGLWNWISSWPNARWQTNSAVEDQAKNLSAIARPYDQGAFGPVTRSHCWYGFTPGSGDIHVC